MTHRKPTHYLKAAILCFLMICVLILLTGCGTHYKAPVEDIEPIRVVDVLLVYNVANNNCHEFMKDVAKRWFDQTGVVLNIVSEIEIEEWTESDYRKAIVEFQKLVGDTGFDIAIGIGETLLSTVQYYAMQIVPLPIPIVNWQGVCDGEYRRYIRIKDQDPWFLMHELGHLFIFSHIHTDFGLMNPGPFYFLPFIAIRDYKLYSIDFDEVQKNKFRDFNVKPDACYIDMVVIEEKDREE